MYEQGDKKILVCGVKRGASSSLRQYVENMNFQEAGINADCWPDCHNSSVNIFIVRHPFERLVSVFRDLKSGEFCIKHVCSEVKRRDVEVLQHLSWSAFVDIVVSSRRFESDVAEAWSPVSQYCGLCLDNLTPNYILHIDNLDKEAGVLQRSLKFQMQNKTTKFPRKRENEAGHSMGYNKEFFSQLSKAQVKFLRTFFIKKILNF